MTFKAHCGYVEPGSGQYLDCWRTFPLLNYQPEASYIKIRFNF